MKVQSVINNKSPMVIIIPRKYYNEEDIKVYPTIKYSIIEPKNFDGTDIVQLFIEVSKVSIPAIAAYLVAKRDSNSITVKYTDGKISAEIKTSLGNKKLNQIQLHNYLEKLLSTIVSKYEGQNDESNH